MTLLDRFRTQSRDKHPDPAVRLAFVDELPLDDRTTIAAIAREDEDPRVRRAAVAKLMAPGALAAIARDDRDEGVRHRRPRCCATSRSRRSRMSARPRASRRSTRSADPRDHRADRQDAPRARSWPMRALSRIDDGAHARVGGAARRRSSRCGRTRLESLRGRGDGPELLAVAMNSDFKDSAARGGRHDHRSRSSWIRSSREGRTRAP